VPSRSNPSGKRRTFAEGEVTLSEWMGEHAFVRWMETSEPWELEAQVITQDES
jgi:GIY-YIG catalytic domain-containing protein